MIARQVMRIKPVFMNLLQNFHLVVIEFLYRGRRAVLCRRIPLDSNRKLSIVMAYALYAIIYKI